MIPEQEQMVPEQTRNRRAIKQMPMLDLTKLWQQASPPVSNAPGFVPSPRPTTSVRRQRKRKRAPADKSAVKPRKYVKPNAACNQDLIRRVRQCQRSLKMSQVDIMRASGLSNT